MKVLFKFTLLTALVIMLNSCSNKSNTPEAVAEKFLNLMATKEYSEAKKLGTSQTRQIIDKFKFIDSVTNMHELKDYTIDSVYCNISEDSKAVCSYRKDGRKEYLNLVKKDGVWLIDLKY